MKKYQGIIEALQKGYHLGCWSSGGRVPVASIINSKDTTLAGGEGGHISEAITNVNSDWSQYLKTRKVFAKRKHGPTLMTGSTEVSDSDLLNKLNHWIVSGSGYMEVTFCSYSSVFVVLLDGYNENIDPVIQLGFDVDLFKAIETAFDAPKKLKS